jgi:hypothetical protein
MSKELVKRLREDARWRNAVVMDWKNGYGAARDWSDEERADYWAQQCSKARRNAAEAADAIERLTYDGIHTCHDDCPRLPCVQRREIDALRAEVAELESWKVAEEAHHHLLLAEVRRLTNELFDCKADVRYLANPLQAHKDALAQAAPKP